MFELTHYKRVVKSYAGTGTIIYGAGLRVECSFNLVQYVDADIYLACLVDDDGEYIDLPGLDLGIIAALIGTENNGMRVQAHEARLMHRNHHAAKHGDIWRHRIELGFLCRSADLTSEANEYLSHASFPIVNLDFVGTRYETIEHAGQRYSAQQLSLRVDDSVVTISAMRGYSETITYLKATRQIDVTCEAVAELSTLDELPKVESKIDSICLLLTLARGTRVTWLNYDVISASGKVTKICLRNKVTKPFAYDSLIHPDDYNETATFVETAYRNLVSAEENWDLSRCLDAYTDAKTAGDFLESRALKLAVCMEMLRANYLERRGSDKILSKSDFKRVGKKLTKCLQDALDELQIDEDGEFFPLMKDHIQQLNYYPFRRVLEDMCAEVALEATATDLKRLVQIRNHLVHYGRFLPGGGTPYEQYKLLNAFAGQFLMSTLHSQLWSRDITWILPPEGDVQQTIYSS